jgi:pyrroline-5-carboxylate reductase
MRLGFVGTGTITTAVVTGLCTAARPPEGILVSPRNAEKAAALAEAFPQVAVAKDNQAVIDGSDWVFLAVLPQMAQEVLAPLRFGDDQRIVSLIATLSRTKLADLVAPATAIFLVIPLPPVARHLGPIALCPPNREVADLLDRIGSAVEVEDERRLYALWSVTALMAPYFALLGRTTDWLAVQGVEVAAGSRYTGAMFHGLSVFCAEAGSEGFDPLTAEHQTPGGLNEQALRTLTAGGWYKQLEGVLDDILARLEGRLTYHPDDIKG